MDFISDVGISLLAHCIGVCITGFLNGGRIKGESSFA